MVLDQVIVTVFLALFAVFLENKRMKKKVVDADYKAINQMLELHDNLSTKEFEDLMVRLKSIRARVK